MARHQITTAFAYLKSDHSIRRLSCISVSHDPVPDTKEDFTAENGVTYTWEDNRWRTKAYKLDESKLESYLPLAGGSMTGNIAMNGHTVSGLGNPNADAQAANKKYVDTRLKKSGGTGEKMTGDLYMGQHKIQGLADPVSATDVANKKYVDAQIAAIPEPDIPTVSNGPTTKYDGNRYCKIGLSTTTLDNGDVMFLNDQLVSEPTPNKIAAIALPIAEFDWDSCAKSGIIKANNGSKNAGYYQVYKLKENAGRNMIVYVKPLVVDDSVRHEDGGALLLPRSVFRVKPFNREKFLLWLLAALLGWQASIFTYATVKCASVKRPDTIQDTCPNLAENCSKFVQSRLVLCWAFWQGQLLSGRLRLPTPTSLRLHHFLHNLCRLLQNRLRRILHRHVSAAKAGTCGAEGVGTGLSETSRSTFKPPGRFMVIFCHPINL